MLRQECDNVWEGVIAMLLFLEAMSPTTEVGLGWALYYNIWMEFKFRFEQYWSLEQQAPLS